MTKFSEIWRFWELRRYAPKGNAKALHSHILRSMSGIRMSSVRLKFTVDDITFLAN